MDNVSWLADLQVFCADVGSIARGKFAWARRHPGHSQEEVHAPANIESLSAAVAFQLEKGAPVALGFEMPLVLPIPLDWHKLGKARPNDTMAPAWSSQIGASAMATGIVQAGWVLRAVHERCPEVQLHLGWDRFTESRSGLLLWEAFVTRDAKGETDEEDAAIGVAAFCDRLPAPDDPESSEIEGPFSLAAALGGWAGWEIDQNELRRACIVVRA